MKVLFFGVFPINKSYNFFLGRISIFTNAMKCFNIGTWEVNLNLTKNFEVT